MQEHRRWVLVGGRVVLPDRVLDDHAVVVNDAIIEGIVSRASLDAALPTVDAQGSLVTPGLIDIHVHGAAGHTFNEPRAEAWQAITSLLGRNGITSACATTATAPIDNLVECLQLTQRWMDAPSIGARIVGAHVEGPYFCMEQRGAQDPAHIRTPDDGSVDRLLDYRAAIKMLSFAPELPGALALTGRLKELGIVAAAGHSSATEQDVERAVECGLRHAIHLWSGQSTTKRVGAWRVPGLLEASLASDVLTGEIIADNKHLPPSLMRMAYRCLGPDRLCIVSDATSGAGLPDGAPFRMGGMEYVVEDGVGMVLDRTAFAGSTTLLNRMVAIVRDVVGVPLVEAVRMASLTPARVLGIADEVGSIAPGKRADLVCFADDFTARRVLVGGRWLDAS